MALTVHPAISNKVGKQKLSGEGYKIKVQGTIITEAAHFFTASNNFQLRKILSQVTP